MNSAISEAQMLSSFLEYLQKHIRYCIVGDVRKLPEDTSKDVDFVVQDEDRGKIPNLIAVFCVENECRFIQCLKHESIAAYYVICWPSGSGGLNFLQLDFCSDYLRYARSLLIAEELLEGVYHVSSRTADVALPVPLPRKAFIYYLLKRVDKKQLTLDNGAYLSEQFALDPKGAEEEMLRFWPESDVVALHQAAADCEWTGIIENVDRFQQQIVTVSIRKARFNPLEILRIIERILRPAGLLVVIRGVNSDQYRLLSAILQKKLLRGFRQAMDAEGVSFPRLGWRIIRSTLVVSRKKIWMPFFPKLVVSVKQQNNPLLSVRPAFGKSYTVCCDSRAAAGDDLSCAISELVLSYMERRVKKQLGF